MKVSILYFSKSGHTKAMAEQIAYGCKQVEAVQVKVMDIYQCDASFLQESNCVIIGTPTYYTGMPSEVKEWLDHESGKYLLGGKLGGAFATADYVYGGAELAIQGILTHMMFRGMMVYSSGNFCGNPPIHLGPIAIFSGQNNTCPDTSCDSSTTEENIFTIYGKRMAEQACRLFTV
jgi:NAD(P)H dehydrogenase (quinone)